LSSADTATDAPEEAPRDEHREEMLARLTEALGDALVGSHIEKGDLWVRVQRDAWRRTAELCRDLLACDYFCFLSGLDWMPATAPNPEAEAEVEEETGEEQPQSASAAPAEETTGIVSGVAGGETRFQIFARYYSTTQHHGITVKADLDDEAPAVESITPVYRAEWHEREAHEMFGFDFPGNPDLRNIYLPGGFEGHPLRKDFPLLAREVKPWPGIVDVEPMPDTGEGDDAAEEESA
jgi:NADH-quinone oxidoreductase subunit C